MEAIVAAPAAPLPIITLDVAPVTMLAPAPSPNIILLVSNLNALNEPDIISEPVICKSLESVAW